MAGSAHENRRLQTPGEETFRQFADHLPALCFIADSGGRLLWGNRRWLAYAGPIRVGSKGTDIACRTGDRLTTFAKLASQWTLEGTRGAIPMTVIQLCAADGQYQPFQTRIEAVPDVSGDTCLLGIMTPDVAPSTRHGNRQQFDLRSRDRDERLQESEARQRAIVDATPECVKIVAPDGSLVYMNRAGLSMIDAEGEDGVGLDVARVIAPNDRATWFQNHQRVCSGESVSWEFNVIGLKGTHRRMETHAVPLPASDGTLQQLAVTRDVTERRRAEERLRESEALLAAFMNNAPIGMYLKDVDGRYLMLNPEMAKVFNKPIDKVVGRSAAELFGAEEAAMIAAHDRRILDTGEPSGVEEYLPGLDEYGWSLVVRFPVPLAEGPSRIGGFDIDISDRKRTELELARSREMLYQSEKLTALGSLLAGVSHELNNPLSVVLTHSQLLEGQADGTPFAERAAKIRAAAARCARIVQSFLAMARQKEPVRERLRINEVVRATLDLMGYALRAADIKVEIELDGTGPLLDADSDQLTQVLLNLIVNAQHALEQQDGIRRLTIRTCADRARQRVTLEVRDNGPGVPADIRRRIFEPFFTSKPQGVGTGIGLALSLGIVEAHGGTLQLADAREGACFRIELPAAVDDAGHQPAKDVAEHFGHSAACALVIDDDPDVGDALAELLASENWTVQVARSGVAAQALLRTQRFDVILSDLRMPGLDGQALFEWLSREQPEAADRLAFVTGDTLGTAAASFLARSGRPVLEKPFDDERLAELIAKLTLTPVAPVAPVEATS